ncbi:C2H2-type zinc finger transcription factor [Mucor lusitanicus]|uniref:C2H2-type zinc finger transcription factor n=1 Tax=Mucor lusitanicus CBS 277.49 TaxID=747725 RepID=A0A168M0W7_MUCCL|nr:C2H2-type zinc finger transcription factor [Mucor lusitanicus CBS 277.49]
MKLRARKKSFPSNIKQEDCKPTTLSNAQSSNNEIANTITFDLTIKQEDLKGHKVLSKQHGKLGSKDYYYCCNICKLRLPNLKSVLEHRKSDHVNKLFRYTMAKNLDKEPDLYDPDFYCETCEKGYSNKKAYRQHLRCAHFMVLKQLPKRATQKTDIAPDPNDPNFHCRACNFTYKRKNNYKAHCRYAHGLKPAKFANQTSSSGSLTDSYCQTCEKRLSSIYHYRRHLFIVHKVDIRQTQPKRNDILPDVNGPNCYCHSCEKKLGSKKSFRQHLKLAHSIFKSAPPQSKLNPDVDDPNNYCRACQKTYNSIYNYRVHLRLVHQMVLLPLRGSVNRKQLPDPYNRDYYCSDNPFHDIRTLFYRQSQRRNQRQQP